MLSLFLFFKNRTTTYIFYTRIYFNFFSLYYINFISKLSLPWFMFLETPFINFLLVFCTSKFLFFIFHFPQHWMTGSQHKNFPSFLYDPTTLLYHDKKRMESQIAPTIKECELWLQFQFNVQPVKSRNTKKTEGLMNQKWFIEIDNYPL